MKFYIFIISIFQIFQKILSSEDPLLIVSDTQIQTNKNYNSSKDDQIVILIEETGNLTLNNSEIYKSGILTNETEKLSNSIIINYGNLITNNLQINTDSSSTYGLYGENNYNYIENSKIISNLKEKNRNTGIELYDSKLYFINSELSNFYSYGIRTSVCDIRLNYSIIKNSPIYSQNDVNFQIENSNIIFDHNLLFSWIGLQVIMSDNLEIKNVTILNDVQLYSVFELYYISNFSIIEDTKIITNNKDKYSSILNIIASYLEVKNSYFSGMYIGIEMHGYEDYTLELNNIQITDTTVCLYTYIYSFREERKAFVNIKNSIMNCQIVFDSYNYMETIIENTTTNLFEMKNKSLPFYYYIEASYDSYTTCNYCKLYNNLSDDYVFFDVYNNSEIYFKNSIIQNKDSINNYFAKVTNNSFLQINSSKIEITNENGNNDGILIEYYGKVEINNTSINISIKDKSFIYINESGSDINIENSTINEIDKFIYLQGNNNNKDITNLYIKSSNLKGNIIGNKYNNLYIKLSNNAVFTGSINKDKSIKNVTMYIEKGSKFVKKGKSYITDLYDENDYTEIKKSTFIIIIAIACFFGIIIIIMLAVIIFNYFGKFKKNKNENEDYLDIKGNLVDDTA